MSADDRLDPAALLLSARDAQRAITLADAARARG